MSGSDDGRVWALGAAGLLVAVSAGRAVATGSAVRVGPRLRIRAREATKTAASEDQRTWDSGGGHGDYPAWAQYELGPGRYVTVNEENPGEGFVPVYHVTVGEETSYTFHSWRDALDHCTNRLGCPRASPAIYGLGSSSRLVTRGRGSPVRVGPRLRAAVEKQESFVEVAIHAIDPQSGRSVEVRARRGWSSPWSESVAPDSWLRIRSSPGMIGVRNEVTRRVVDAIVRSTSMTLSSQVEVEVSFPTNNDVVLSRFDLAIAIAAMVIHGVVRSPPPVETYFVGGLSADGRVRLVEQVVPLWKPYAREPQGRVFGDPVPQLVAPVGTTVKVDLGGARESIYKVGGGSREFYGWTLHGIKDLSELKSFVNDQEWGQIHDQEWGQIPF